MSCRQSTGGVECITKVRGHAVHDDEFLVYFFVVFFPTTGTQLVLRLPSEGVCLCVCCLWYVHVASDDNVLIWHLAATNWKCTYMYKLSS